MPSREDFVIYLWEMGYLTKDTDITTYEVSKRDIGLINMHAKRFLINKATEGGRHSGNYLTLLKEMNMTQDLVHDDKVVIVMNNESENKITMPKGKDVK